MALRLLDTKTRFIDQDTFGLDKNTAKWGWLKYFLDLTLVTGTDPLDVNSIFIREEDNYWLFDLSLPEATSFKANLSVIELSNSSIPQLNKIHRVQEVKEGVLTIALLKEDISVKPSDIPDSLGVKIKLVPLGYKKTFEEGLKVVYESANPENKRCYLRVDNGCPIGHDPATAKFARVSMFSDIRYIDDYEFRLGRYKAPAESDNYTVCETSIKYVWPHVKVTSAGLATKTNRIIPKFFIIGDDKTFYFFLDSVYESNYLTDCFMFGEYNKLMYREDPLPFMLYAPFYGSSLGTAPTEYDSFFNNIATSGNIHLMSQDVFSNFTPRASDNASKWQTLTGKTTAAPYKPYKNEVALHPKEFLLRSIRTEGSFVECSLRGIKTLNTAIPPNTPYQPYNMQIFPELDYLMWVAEQTSTDYYYSFGVELRDWDGLA